jgi:hypothetical protein
MRNIILLTTLVLGSAGSLILYMSSSVDGADQARISPWHTDKIAQKSLMAKTSQNSLKSRMNVSDSLSLQIWQEDPNLPPNGISPTADRPLGFASLSFLLENKTEMPIVLRLQRIEIRPVGAEKPLMSLPAKDLTLGPLEYAPQRYQLSNREGYGNIKQVEAVVIYQLDGQQHTLRSAPVRVP